MATSNFPFPEGNSINRPLIFNGEGYHYWKTRMQIFIEAIDLNIYEAIESGPIISTMVMGNATIGKPREQWDEDERRRVQYNLKIQEYNYFCIGHR